MYRKTVRKRPHILYEFILKLRYGGELQQTFVATSWHMVLRKYKQSNTVFRRGR
jgi:hypothetical protein